MIENYKCVSWGKENISEQWCAAIFAFHILSRKNIRLCRSTIIDSMSVSEHSVLLYRGGREYKKRTKCYRGGEGKYQMLTSLNRNLLCGIKTSQSRKVKQFFYYLHLQAQTPSSSVHDFVWKSFLKSPIFDTPSSPEVTTYFMGGP